MPPCCCRWSRAGTGAEATAPQTMDDVPDTLVPMPDDDVRALLDVHEVQRRAHLEGDGRSMASVFGDVIHEASGGAVRTMTGAELERRFTERFAQVRYLEWSDVEPPLIEVAGDTAWMLVRVHAHRTDAAGAPLPDFGASWIAIYERSGAGWKLRAIASSVVEAD